MLSLCMVVRNEAAVLERCLDSVAPVVDEIVVVDTGSTDATIAIARSRGARVVHHDFRTVHFAAARNVALTVASGDHVLVLDADETLDPASVRVVPTVIAGDTEAGHVVNRRNLPAEPGKPPWMDHAVRLFPRNPLYRYAGRVHETVDSAILRAGGKLHTSPIIINHHLAPEAELRAKGMRYLELLLQESPDDPERLVFLAAEYHRLERYDDATVVAERVAELAPDDFDAQFTAALYHFFYAGDPDRAATDVAAALRLRPDAPEAHELLAAIEGAGRSPSGCEKAQRSSSHADSSGERENAPE